MTIQGHQTNLHTVLHTLYVSQGNPGDDDFNRHYCLALCRGYDCILTRFIRISTTIPFFFTKEKTEIKVLIPRSHSQEMAEEGSIPKAVTKKSPLSPL